MLWIIQYESDEVIYIIAEMENAEKTEDELNINIKEIMQKSILRRYCMIWERAL